MLPEQDRTHTTAVLEQRAVSSEEVPRGDRDHRGSRRLGGRETAVWYVVAGLSYIVAGLAQKGLLNWVVGPLWLVAVVVAGPALVDRIRRRT